VAASAPKSSSAPQSKAWAASSSSVNLVELKGVGVGEGGGGGGLSRSAVGGGWRGEGVGATERSVVWGRALRAAAACMRCGAVKRASRRGWGHLGRGADGKLRRKAWKGAAFPGGRGRVVLGRCRFRSTFPKPLRWSPPPSHTPHTFPRDAACHWSWYARASTAPDGPTRGPCNETWAGYCAWGRHRGNSARSRLPRGCGRCAPCLIVLSRVASFGSDRGWRRRTGPGDARRGSECGGRSGKRFRALKSAEWSTPQHSIDGLECCITPSTPHQSPRSAQLRGSELTFQSAVYVQLFRAVPQRPMTGSACDWCVLGYQCQLSPRYGDTWIAQIAL